MPSPLAHIAVSYPLYRAVQCAGTERPRTSPHRLFLAIAGLSLLPDLDSVFGVVFGNFGQRHNNVSHSFGFATLASLGVGTFSRLIASSGFRFWFPATFLAYSSHLWLDYWSTRRGIMALWPFSNRRFSSPVKVFYGLRWSDRPRSMTHLWTGLTELIFAVLIIVLTRFLAKNWCRPCELD